MEVRSDTTVLPLILCGEGMLPVINITPSFVVYRLETKRNRFAELRLKIDNFTETEADVRFEQIFEIEGQLADISKQREEVPEPVETAKGPKNKKAKFKSDTARNAGPKCSDSLTELELEAIGKRFSKIEGRRSHFELSHKEPFLHIQPYSNQTVTIFCGEPEVLRKMKPEKAKKDTRMSSKSDKSSDSESSGWGSMKSGGSKKNVPLAVEYITQYNIYVGHYYIRNVIVICTVS